MFIYIAEHRSLANPGPCTGPHSDSRDLLPWPSVRAACMYPSSKYNSIHLGLVRLSSQSMQHKFPCCPRYLQCCPVVTVFRVQWGFIIKIVSQFVAMRTASVETQTNPGRAAVAQVCCSKAYKIPETLRCAPALSAECTLSFQGHSTDTAYTLAHTQQII